MDDYVAGLEPERLAALGDEVQAELAQVFPSLSAPADGRGVALQHERHRSHRAVAHQYALNGAGLQSVKHMLRGEHYTFVGLDSRYRFDAYNRKGINEHLGIPRSEQMPIYNRPNPPACFGGNMLRVLRSGEPPASSVLERPLGGRVVPTFSRFWRQVRTLCS